MNVISIADLWVEFSRYMDGFVVEALPCCVMSLPCSTSLHHIHTLQQRPCLHAHAQDSTRSTLYHDHHPSHQLSHRTLHRLPDPAVHWTASTAGAAQFRTSVASAADVMWHGQSERLSCILLVPRDVAHRRR